MFVCSSLVINVVVMFENRHIVRVHLCSVKSNWTKSNVCKHDHNPGSA